MLAESRFGGKPGNAVSAELCGKNQSRDRCGHACSGCGPPAPIAAWKNRRRKTADAGKAGCITATRRPSPAFSNRRKTTDAGKAGCIRPVETRSIGSPRAPAGAVAHRSGSHLGCQDVEHWQSQRRAADRSGSSLVCFSTWRINHNRQPAGGCHNPGPRSAPRLVDRGAAPLLRGGATIPDRGRADDTATRATFPSLQKGQCWKKSLRADWIGGCH